MKSKILFPAIFIAVLALSRIPGLLPWNFSVVYAFVFCAGVFFPRKLVWWLPLAAIFVTDIGLNFYYQYGCLIDDVWSGPNLANLAFNYAAYAVLLLLGRGFKPQTSILKLVGGGLLGAAGGAASPLGARSVARQRAPASKRRRARARSR